MNCRELREQLVLDTTDCGLVTTIGTDALADNGANRWLNDGIRWLSLHFHPPVETTRIKSVVPAGARSFSIPGIRSLNELWGAAPSTGVPIRLTKTDWDTMRCAASATESGIPQFYCRNPRIEVQAPDVMSQLSKFYVPVSWEIISEGDPYIVGNMVLEPFIDHMQDQNLTLWSVQHTPAGIMWMLYGVFSGGSLENWIAYNMRQMLFFEHDPGGVAVPSTLTIHAPFTVDAPAQWNMSVRHITRTWNETTPEIVETTNIYKANGQWHLPTNEHGLISQSPALIPLQWTADRNGAMAYWPLGTDLYSVPLPVSAEKQLFCLTANCNNNALRKPGDRVYIMRCDVLPDAAMDDDFLLYPTPAEPLTLEGLGSVYASELSEDSDETWWTVNHPGLVLRAAAMCRERVKMQGESRAREMSASILEEIGAIEDSFIYGEGQSPCLMRKG